MPVKIEFGAGVSKKLFEITKNAGLMRGILICDKMFEANGTAAQIAKNTPSICGVYCEITPNPLLCEVEAAARLLREKRVDYVAALGGGSSLDLAKFACSLALSDRPAEEYFYKRAVFANRHIPLFAMPTTAGTGSEVTPVSVCNDQTTGIKAPLSHPNFYPHTALIDPELTLSVPSFVTATTGLDAMSHALEAIWSVNHQPICDALAAEALSSIFRHLEQAYDDGGNLEARTGMSYGALLAGLAFGQTKTAAVHACSYPFSSRFHLSHGEACAFTLDLFVRINAEAGRIDALSKKLGFENAEAMADRIFRLKKKFGLKTTLADIGSPDVRSLAEECVAHPLFQNNPVKLTVEELAAYFKAFL